MKKIHTLFFTLLLFAACKSPEKPADDKDVNLLTGATICSSSLPKRYPGITDTIAIPEVRATVNSTDKKGSLNWDDAANSNEWVGKRISRNNIKPKRK